MAVTGVSAGDVFTSSQKTFLYAGDVGGNQVLIGTAVTQAPLDLFIVRPSNDAYTPLVADNGGNQYKVNQDTYVSYPDGRRELYRYNGTTQVLIDSWLTDDGTLPTVWVVPTGTVNSWADPDAPTDNELNTAYDAIVASAKQKIGDVLRLETNGYTFIKFDAEDGTQQWLPVDSDPVSIDGRGYVIQTGDNNRDTAPVPADVGATKWQTDVRIEKILNNGVTEIYAADTETTATLVRVQLPTEPFTTRPDVDGWKVGEVYRFLSTDAAGRERVQRYRWRSQAGTLVPYEVLASSS